MPGETSETCVKWRQLWWAILAVYVVGQLVAIPVAVLVAVSITRAEREPNITQTVTIEQVDTVQQLIKKEMTNGLRHRVGQPSVGNRRPDSE
jgi:hypothetical protein